jgi:hypothetical protein
MLFTKCIRLLMAAEKRSNLRNSKPMNILFRLATMLIAGFSIWQFSDGFWLAMQTLREPQEVRWFNLLSAVAEGVLGPGLALTAIALAIFNEHLLIAVVIAASALVIYAMPLIAFMIAIAIYGF